MNTDYIWGIKGIAEFFDLSATDVFTLLKRGGIPGVRKLKRAWTDTHNGGGRGVWVMSYNLAERYRDIRSNTPVYDPGRATEALLNKYADSGATNIPELFDRGLIDDTDWCNALNHERSISHLNRPILMHPKDLAQWLSKSRLKGAPKLPNTEEIFRSVRRGKRSG